jgi:hypothetical protein
MWQYLNATKLLSGEISWELGKGEAPSTLSDHEGLELRLNNFPGTIGRAKSTRKVRDAFNRTFEANDIRWIKAGDDDWNIDLDELVKFENSLESLQWLRGPVSIVPRYEPEEVTSSGHVYEPYISFVFTEESVREATSVYGSKENGYVVFYSWQSDLRDIVNCCG